DLADADAAKAQAAVGLLAANPDQAVPLLKQRLRPAAPTDPGRLRQLVADLDSNRFEQREQASRELKRLGEEAEPVLRKPLQGAPSAESRRRIDELLSTMAPWVVEDPEALRRVRAVRALRQTAGPEARQILEKLAEGAPAARETKEARAALGR